MNASKKSRWPKLPVAFKRKWVKALRSGKFTQADGSLYERGNHCCLGVAANLCGISNQSMRDYGMPDQLSERSKNKLPVILLRQGVSGPLSKKNDSGKWPFPRIATWIEEYL